MVRENFHLEKMATESRKKEGLYHSYIFKIQEQQHIFRDKYLQVWQ